MKMYKILIAAAAAAAVLSACGGTDTGETVRLSEEAVEITTEPNPVVSGEYTGETDIAVTLPGGDWEITMDNQNSTVFVQGDKTISASVIDDETFNTGDLPMTKDDVIDRYTTAGGSNIDVVEFSVDETEERTSFLRYTIKYTSSGSSEVRTLLTSTEIINEHKAIVVDGIINGDADDAEISMMREAVDAAAQIKGEE
ncbi:MAG: hypothetical protein LUD77_10720 [Clostridiales bacterium]|nr:hypothetical protein [Clostridiales bacterium]